MSEVIQAHDIGPVFDLNNPVPKRVNAFITQTHRLRDICAVVEQGKDFMNYRNYELTYIQDASARIKAGEMLSVFAVLNTNTAGAEAGWRVSVRSNQDEIIDTDSTEPSPSLEAVTKAGKVKITAGVTPVKG